MKIDRFEQIARKINEKSILVIGDLMLDEYFWGSTSRISPEAPVPIVDIDRIENTAGGAGNVALNLAKMGAGVNVLGLIGNDKAGNDLAGIFEKSGVGTSGLIVSADRPTTVKTRIIAQNQQILRTDREDPSGLNDNEVSLLMASLRERAEESDAVIIADYNKGLLSEKIIALILAECSRQSIPVYVDPKFDNFFTYRQVRLFKPNTKEFLAAMAGRPGNEDEFLSLGNELIRRIDAELLLVTRGKNGITIFHNGEYDTIPTRAQKVHDVSGAGDTVISVFTLADLSGASLIEAAELANLAAGRVCAEVGAVPIDQAMLKEMISIVYY